MGYHTVRSGETLYCIGRGYRVVPSAIARQNGLVYPYALRAGQVLAIPNVPWTNIPAGPVCPVQFGGGGTATPPPPACLAMYTVQRGDTLYGIASRYHTTVWALIVANNIQNPNCIFPGQVLCIR